MQEVIHMNQLAEKIVRRQSLTKKKYKTRLRAAFDIIGVSLSKPHTSVTSLCTCIHLLACVHMFAWTNHLQRSLNQQISLARAQFKGGAHTHFVDSFEI